MSEYLAGFVLLLLAAPLAVSFVVGAVRSQRQMLPSRDAGKSHEAQPVPLQQPGDEQACSPVTNSTHYSEWENLQEAEYVGRSLAQERKKSIDFPAVQRKTAREERMDKDRSRELVRSALRGVTAHGYYVFDDLTSEESGILDFLAVGPATICAIVVRNEPGVITALPDKTVLLDGWRFADDPRQQADELRADVISRLPDTDKPIDYLICFSRADMYMGKDLDPYEGLCTVWGLSSLLDPLGEEALNAAEVAEYAELVQKIYDRPPFVVPESGSTL